MDLRTGDVLLFAETGSWFDFLLRRVSGQRWTHVAVVVKDPPDLPPGDYVLEAGAEAGPDLLSGRKVFGTQLQFLRSLVDRKTFVRRLEPPLTQVEESAFWRLALSLDRRPYDLNPSDWEKALGRLEGRQESEQQSRSFWCSALVAYLFVELGLLDKSVPWTLVAPHEWAADPPASLPLQGHKLLGLEKVQLT